MLKKGNSTDKMPPGKTYSTFVDNIEENSSMMSRKSSTISLHQPQKPLPSTASTSSFQRHYNKPPVVPTTTSPLHHRENFVAGTGSYSRFFFIDKKNVGFANLGHLLLLANNLMDFITGRNIKRKRNIKIEKLRKKDRKK